MGYVLPAIPETLLETLKHSPSKHKAIKQVDRIERVKSATYRQSYAHSKTKQHFLHPYKGKNFDQYV